MAETVQKSIFKLSNEHRSLYYFRQGPNTDNNEWRGNREEKSRKRKRRGRERKTYFRTEKMGYETNVAQKNFLGKLLLI